MLQLHCQYLNSNLFTKYIPTLPMEPEQVDAMAMFKPPNSTFEDEKVTTDYQIPYSVSSSSFEVAYQ